MPKTINLKVAFMAKAIAAIVFLCCLPLAAQQVMVEAESFSNLGGWAIDSQYMDQMGSPFSLAHGLGTPVADARTEVQIADPARYRIWVSGFR